VIVADICHQKTLIIKRGCEEKLKKKKVPGGFNAGGKFWKNLSKSPSHLYTGGQLKEEVVGEEDGETSQWDSISLQVEV